MTDEISGAEQNRFLVGSVKVGGITIPAGFLERHALESAAPELLAASKAALDFMHGIGCTSGPVIDQLEAAIGKAEGGR